MPDTWQYITDNNKNGVRKGLLKIHLLIFIAVIVIVLVFVLIADMVLVNPKNEADYIAQCNELSKPDGFDPNENAWPDLQRTFDRLIEPPDNIKVLIYSWPKDMNQAELAMVSQWVASNAGAVEFLTRAASKKYMWHLYESKSGDMNDILSPPTKPYRFLTQFLIMKAIILASEGDPRSAFENLHNIYKIGYLLSGHKSVTEQFLGISMRALVIDTAIEVTAYANPSEQILADFQKAISQTKSQYPLLASFEVERFAFLDAVQSDFAENKKGFMHTARNMVSKYGLMSLIVSRKNTLEVAEQAFAYIDIIVDKTPYELKAIEAEKELKNITQKNKFIDKFAASYLRLIEYSQRTAIHSDGLIVVLALQRYKIKTGLYPDSLSVLQQSGYIDKIPIDPYSGNPLIYKKTADDFMLYSYANDIDDDGGEHNSRWASIGSGDYVFWPIQEIMTDGIRYR